MMVAAAPRIGAVLPGFLEFARGAVLVAHNAPFDLGFLQGRVRRERHRLAGGGLGRHRRPGPPAAHPRRGAQLQAGHPGAVLLRHHRRPRHRALDDARATVDVLHGLFERLGPARHHLARGADRPHPAGRPRAAAQAAPGRRRAARARRLPLPRPARRAALRRHVERPAQPGAQLLLLRRAAQPDHRDGRAGPAGGRHPVRARPRGRRPRAAADRRAQAPLQPPLAVPRAGAVGAAHRGAVPAAVGGAPGPARAPGSSSARSPTGGPPTPRSPPSTRRCRCGSARPGSPPRVLGTACALAGMGRCGAPCTGAQSRATSTPRSPRSSGPPSTAIPRALVAPLLARVDRLAAEERYEDAAVLRDRIAVLVRAVRRRQRLESLAAVPELVLARPDGAGGWQLSVVRRGRLVAAGGAPRGTSVRGTLAGLLTTAETPTGPDDELAAIGRRDRAGPALDGEAGHPAGRADRHPRLPRAGHRRLQRLPRPGRGRPRRAATRSPTAGRWAPGPGRSACRAGRARPAGAPASIAGVITAIVMIDAATDSIPEVAEAIADLDGVSEVYSVAGDVDLIADRPGARVRAGRRGDRRPDQQGARRASTPRPTSPSAPTPGTTSRRRSRSASSSAD